MTDRTPEQILSALLRLCDAAESERSGDFAVIAFAALVRELDRLLRAGHEAPPAWSLGRASGKDSGRKEE